MQYALYLGFIFCRNESIHIMNIVQHVTRLLDKLFVADHPVGLEVRMQEVIQLLNNKPVEHAILVGIHGMGGVGKTTLAKAIYNQMGCSFEATSFLSNAGPNWKHGDLVSLQQKLLSDICKTKEIKIDTIESGKRILQERLCQKRIFLVLDNVCDLEQLYALCGRIIWFGQGSRIIVTTRDKYILDQLKVGHVYEMKKMDDNESLELFSWYAFNQPGPSEDFAELSRDVVNLCQGLPLSLIVIANYLCGREETKWKSVIEKYISPENISPENIMDVLRKSFDRLESEEQEIFLHIASLFNGMHRDDVIQILNYSGHFAETGMTTLVEKSLVSVDGNNNIKMHEILQEMGREIISQNSTGMAEVSGQIWFLKAILDLP